MGELNSMFTVTACSKGGREAEGGAATLHAAATNGAKQATCCKLFVSQAWQRGRVGSRVARTC